MGKPAQYFRAGAGAVIINDQGHVLVIERDKWSLTQLKNTLTHFCRGERQVDAVMKSELENL